MKPDYNIIAFESPALWREWLANNHASTNGVWIRFYKKASNVATVRYAEALDDALCYGWIDGQVKKYDDVSYIQKFTPRRKKSLWSKHNITHIARLTKAGLMMPAGIAEVERAQQDGRWDAAYDKPSEMKVPDYFLLALEDNPNAKAFFETLNKSNKYSIAWRLQTAKKEETKLRRQEKFIEQLNQGILP